MAQVRLNLWCPYCYAVRVTWLNGWHAIHHASDCITISDGWEPWEEVSPSDPLFHPYYVWSEAMMAASVKRDGLFWYSLSL